MITINWKTYKQLHNKYSIDWLVKHGYLEEVKENKDSILEKLREELDRLVELFVLPQSSRAAILDFLTSLETPPEEFDTKQERISYRDLCSNTETKEEPTHKWEHQNDVCSKVTPQFTPWQEIEVSNDGENWERKYFQRITDSDLTDWCIYQVWDTTITYVPEFWKFARPIEDKIELLPAYEPSEPDWRDTQISLLTRTVNQLISK